MKLMIEDNLSQHLESFKNNHLSLAEYCKTNKLRHKLKRTDKLKSGLVPIQIKISEGSTLKILCRLKLRSELH